MALQPSAGEHVDRTAQAPFLLRLFWRDNRPLDAHEFSVAPPADPGPASDYYALLPSHIRNSSVEIYTWPSCTLRELTGLLTSVLTQGTLPDPAVGTRLVYKFIFPDTRAQVSESGRGKWIDKPLGSVVIGESEYDGGLGGESEKTLADARFVIGDYIACSIYPPDENGRAVPPPPPPGRPGRENGFRGGRGGGGGGGGGYRDRGYNNRDQGPPPGDWRRGDVPPGRGYGGGGGGGYGNSNGGYGGGGGGYNDGGYNGGGYGGGGRGRPY